MLHRSYELYFRYFLDQFLANLHVLNASTILFEGNIVSMHEKEYWQWSCLLHPLRMRSVTGKVLLTDIC